MFRVSPTNRITGNKIVKWTTLYCVANRNQYGDTYIVREQCRNDVSSQLVISMETNSDANGTLKFILVNAILIYYICYYTCADMLIYHPAHRHRSEYLFADETTARLL